MVIEFDSDIGFWTVCPILWRGKSLGQYKRRAEAERALKVLGYLRADHHEMVWTRPPETPKFFPSATWAKALGVKRDRRARP